MNLPHSGGHPGPRYRSRTKSRASQRSATGGWRRISVDVVGHSLAASQPESEIALVRLVGEMEWASGSPRSAYGSLPGPHRGLPGSGVDVFHAELQFIEQAKTLPYRSQRDTTVAPSSCARTPLRLG